MEQIYTMPELAKHLKVSEAYAQNLRKSGLIKVIKLGSYKVRESEVNRFLATNEGKDLTDPFNVKEL